MARFAAKLSSELKVRAEIDGIKLITANIGEAAADEARAAADRIKESGDDVVAVIAATQSESTCTSAQFAEAQPLRQEHMRATL